MSNILSHKPTQGTTQLTSSPSYAQKELFALAQLLHVIHHHNKNQHRLSKWYKSLSTFRRQVSKVLLDVQGLDTALAFSVSNKTKDGRLGGEKLGKEGKYVRLAREKVEERVKFWNEFCMERWFEAFSNLTADSQYASLGLTLLGCLAKARSVVRPFSKVKDAEKGDDQKEEEMSLVVVTNDDLGEVIQRKAVEETKSVKTKRPVMVDNEIDIDDEDIGIKAKVAKQKKRKTVQPEGMNTATQLVEPTISKSNRKKKRKQGDAFDDLFSSLL